MLHKTRKRLLRWILLPITALLILIVIAVGILYGQRQRLVTLAVKDLNQQIPGELIIGSSDISIFQNFPYISIGLNNVQLYADKSRTGKAIYQAGRMFVGFSLSDILRQEYHSKVIAFKNGRLDLVLEKDGKLNIEEAFRMPADSAASKKPLTTALDLDVKKFVLKEMEISFLDKGNGQRVVSQITRIQASFRDDSRQVDADLHGDMVVDYTHPGSGLQLAHKHLVTDIKLSYDKNSRLLKLPEGRVQLENSVFNPLTRNGRPVARHSPQVDLHLSGDKTGPVQTIHSPSLLKSSPKN